MARSFPGNPFSQTDHVGSPADVAVGRRILFYLSLVVTALATGAALLRVPLPLVLGVVVAVFSLAIILTRPYIGLLLYTVLFVLRPGEIWPALTGLHLERIVGTLTLASLFIHQHRLERQIVLDGSRQTQLLLMFVGAVVLSVPFAYWRRAALDGLMEVLRIAAFYIMVVHLVDTRARLRRFLWTFCLLITFVAVASLSEYFSGGAFFAQGIDRAVALTSFGNNPNELGTTLASAVPLFVLCAFHPSLRGGRLLLACIAAVMLVTIVFTGSRASMLGLLAGCVYLWWRSRRRLLVGMAGVCLLVLGFSIMPDQYKSRYSTMTQQELDASSASRIVTWKAGLSMLIDRPLFGVGIRCYGAAHGMQYSSTRHRSWLEAHSLYMQVLGELGLIGALAFFSFLVEMLRLNRSTARRLAQSPEDWSFEKVALDAIFAGLVVLLVSGVFGHSLLRRTWYVFAATGLAILRVYLQQGERAPEQAPAPQRSSQTALEARSLPA